VGVALTTFATLLLELSLTRIYSVVFYYHFAFLAISIALFGLGVGGILSYVVAARPGAVFRRLGALAMANSVLVVFAVAFLLSRPPDLDAWSMAAVYLASAAPFVVAGIIVSLAISESVERVDRVYFFDLMGAAAGAILLVVLLNAFGGPNTVIAAGVLFAASGAVWYSLAGSARGRIVAVGVALGLVWLVVLNAKRHVIDVQVAKGSELLDERFVKWNSFSRIAVKPEKPASDILLIVIDGDASTAIARFDFERMSEDERKGMLRDGPGLVYALRPGAKTLVIGPGGGWDVARALASGSKDVTGVEINPIIANTIMRQRFPYLSNRLYFRPEVRIFVEDGRSFIRRSGEKYQVLQATLVDTWASTAAGAFALSENNLYTVEAFEDYLSHLTDDGVLSFTRWGFEPPRESLRVVTLAAAALEKLGESEPWRHVIVARENAQIIDQWGATDTILISRKPFDGATLARAKSHFAENGIKMAYMPGDESGSFAAFLRAADRDAFFRGHEFDVTPVTDDRPFFFYTVQPKDLWEFFFHSNPDTADFKINRAVPLLFGLIGISIAGTLIIIALPPLVLGSRLPTGRGVRWFLLYFLFIGIGYILIQVALIQKFVLFLGHPTYALTVIVFSMLVSSGLGSFFSRRLGGFERAGIGRILAGVAGAIAILAFAVPPITSAGITWPMAVRVLVSVALIAPAGFLMGMPFPSGLARLEAWHKPSVRWAWSLNAAASVLGSAAAIFLALYLGLRVTLLIGGALYLCALMVSRMANEEAV
jgi:hypothetical protein